jgi:hypothetical protein
MAKDFWGEAGTVSDCDMMSVVMDRTPANVRLSGIDCPRWDNNERGWQHVVTIPGQ